MAVICFCFGSRILDTVNYWFACVYIFLPIVSLQKPHQIVAIKAITKKNLAKSQNLLGKEIKILKVSNTPNFTNFLKMKIIKIRETYIKSRSIYFFATISLVNHYHNIAG